MNEKDCLMLQYIYEEQNITKAAERLYITQPALSYRLQQIEREFNIQLVMKSGKRIKFTAEGEYLVGFAKEMLKELSRTKDILQNMAGEMQGTVRIGASSIFARYYLPHLLKRISTLHPKLKFNVYTGVSTVIVNMLQNDTVHLGIVKGDYSWGESAHLLAQEDICLINKQPVRLKELPFLDQINYSSSQKGYSNSKHSSHTPLSEMIQSWWNERYNQPPTISMQVDQYETCKEMVKCGLGYSFIPQVFINNEDKGELYIERLVRKNGEPLKRNTWLLYKEKSKELFMVKRMVELMSELSVEY